MTYATNVKYPLVSISIVTYNQKDYLKECIESCLNQTYPNFEIIVADDASEDGSQEMLLDYKVSYPRIFKLFLSEVNQGVSKNCNKAWKACSGDWIKTIAGDDKLMPNCLSIYMNEIIHAGTVSDIYFANMQNFNQHKLLDIVKPNTNFFILNANEKILALLKRNELLAPTSFIKRKTLHAAGYADEQYAMIEDYPLWLSLALMKASFGYINGVTVLYRVHDSLSQSTHKIANLRYESDLYRFKKNIIWSIRKTGFLEKIDVWGAYYQKRIGFLMLANKKGIAYCIVCFLFLPFRLNSLFFKLKMLFKFK